MNSRRWLVGFFFSALCLALACGPGHRKEESRRRRAAGGVTGTACPEIFATGFRNPWRMNFDPVTHVLYVGDVGQDAEEEIDIVSAGGNYGWDCMEGELVHTVDPSPVCSTTPPSAFTAPEVVHDRTDAQAITGGVVYRGASIPDLFGHYVYGDFVTKKFFEFDAGIPNDPSQPIPQLAAQVSAFGQGRDGEIYAVTFDTSIQKIVTTGSGLAALAFADAFPGRSFTRPVKLVQHPTDNHRWYVVEQGGAVKTFLDTDTAVPAVAANLAALVSLGNTTSGEQGLLGMAFDPGFASSGEVYFAYTDNAAGTVVLARWVSTDHGLTFAPDTSPIVLSTPHDRDNHNASDIVFGSDGFLYYSMGDGGGEDDPDNNGQNASVLLGKILRIDVNSAPPAGKTYAIPASNPNAANPQCG